MAEGAGGGEVKRAQGAVARGAARGALASAAALPARAACVFVLLAVLLSLAPAPAWPHEGGLLAYADIRVDGNRVRYAITLSAASARVVAGDEAAMQRAGADLAQQLAQRIAVRAGTERCAPGAAQIKPTQAGASLEIVLDYRCPAPPRTLTLRDDSYDVLGKDLHTLAKISWKGDGNDRSETFRLDTDARDASVTIGGATAAAPASFFVVGVEHFATGYDHILFLAALLVRTTSMWLAAKVITAFTLAHSLTLGLAAMGVVVPPEKPVEIAIALSIAWVAFTNLFSKRADASLLAAPLLFGLVHGLGFSSALREILPPDESVLWPLLKFNLGVEAGQLIAAALVLLVLRWLHARPWHERALRGVSWAIFAAGVALVAARVVF